MSIVNTLFQEYQVIGLTAAVIVLMSPILLILTMDRHASDSRIAVMVLVIIILTCLDLLVAMATASHGMRLLFGLGVAIATMGHEMHPTMEDVKIGLMFYSALASFVYACSKAAPFVVRRFEKRSNRFG